MEPAVRLDEIRRCVDRAPFRPFRICMSDGSEHVVLNPKFVFVTRHTVMLGVPEDGDVAEDVKHCDTLHITRVETLRAESPPDSSD